MKGSLFPLCCLFLFLSALSLEAVDFSEGLIRLSLHEEEGYFSLYYLSDPARSLYEPLFSAKDPRTTFLALRVNNKVYRLGESSAFRFRVEAGRNPSLIFESSFLRVIEEFSFIRTAGSSGTNGVKVSITVENLNGKQAFVGARLLIDTMLGEGKGGTPFVTVKGKMNGETAYEANSTEHWWLSGNGNNLSLMGSISEGVNTPAQSIIFSNWKRLNDASWKINYSPGRNFHYIPFSIGDSAVCYYFDQKLLDKGETQTWELLLASGDEQGFAAVSADLRETGTFPDNTPDRSSMQADLETLRELLRKLDEYMSPLSGVSDEEISALELSISRLRDRYNKR
ncbi:MAG: hypothetical protein LBG22_04315 [Treponema sp.]|jgi:hypothetical protein|nr:hypothetical protein [Treponema sp.]